jgi:uncharacterized protein
MKFWDSSALVPLLVEAVSSERMIAFYKEDCSIVAWWGATVECASAIARLEREAKLDTAAVALAFDRLTALRCDWHEIQPVDILREIAVRLLRVHTLRAADTMQLAAAILASENRPSALEFVSLDSRLSIAATREGFKVIEA